jgi:hypothetical protein
MSRKFHIQAPTHFVVDMESEPLCCNTVEEDRLSLDVLVTNNPDYVTCVGCVKVREAKQIEGRTISCPMRAFVMHEYKPDLGVIQEAGRKIAEAIEKKVLNEVMQRYTDGLKRYITLRAPGYTQVYEVMVDPGAADETTPPPLPPKPKFTDPITTHDFSHGGMRCVMCGISQRELHVRRNLGERVPTCDQVKSHAVIVNRKDNKVEIPCITNVQVEEAKPDEADAMMDFFKKRNHE